MPRGFFCADMALRYPYHDCQISVPMLVVSMLLLPLLFISVVEIIRACNDFRMREYLCRLAHSWAIFSGGFIATYLTTELAKNVIGRLRPHFYAACQPRLANGSTCEDAMRQDHAYGYVYVDEYVCSNTRLSAAQLRELFVSFPSAHASISFYAMLYLAFYLNQTWRPRSRPGRAICHTMRHLVQFVMMLLAWYVALSRVVDHWHHWSDVLAGIVLGVLYAVVTAVYVGNLHRPFGDGIGVIGFAGVRRQTATSIAAAHCKQQQQQQQEKQLMDASDCCECKLQQTAMTMAAASATSAVVVLPP